MTEKEKSILRIVQKNIPETLTPYADIAKACDATEEEVIALIRRMKESRAIRRFGAMIRHQKTDWVHNAMVAWKVSPEDLEAFGFFASDIRNISHVYYRPSTSADWPYTMYTMVHGRTPSECDETIASIKTSWPQCSARVLKTLKELKKVSMVYF